VRYLSLFSGIEAASVAWGDLGWECAAVAEVEPFPCTVLAHHHPGVPNLGDVTKITEATIQALGHIDIVVFGSPCQDLSVAGQRRGLINEHGDITRSGLFFTAINIFHWSGARFALWENVPGAFSSGQGRDFASVVSFMTGLDDVAVPPNGWGTEGAALGDNGLLEWGTLDAQWFGVAQRRRRVFALLDTGNWASRPPILLEPEGLRGDSAPIHNEGEITWWDGKQTSQTLDAVLYKGQMLPEKNRFPVAAVGELLSLPVTATKTEIALNAELTTPSVHVLDLLKRKSMTTVKMTTECFGRNVLRRITPRECERLQGFPDDHTQIPYRNKPAADGPRYKALGNSMAVPVMRWIGIKIMEAVWN